MILNMYLHKYLYSSEKTRRFCASLRVTMVSKPVSLWKGSSMGGQVLIGARRVLLLHRIYLLSAASYTSAKYTYT